MYAISNVNDYRVGKNAFHTVETIEEAKAFLAEKFVLIAFDYDDENDAVDALVKMKNGPAVDQIAVERI